MSLLPQKKTPQEWTDVVLPIFDQPEETKPREKSKSDQQKAAGVRYTRHKSPVKPGCNHCIEEHRRSGAQIRSATYIRTEGEQVTYLCFPHVADLRNREMLGQPDVTR